MNQIQQKINFLRFLDKIVDILIISLSILLSIISCEFMQLTYIHKSVWSVFKFFHALVKVSMGPGPIAPNEDISDQSASNHEQSESSEDSTKDEN